MPRSYDNPSPTAQDLVSRIHDLFADPSLDVFRRHFEEWIQQRATAIAAGHSGDFFELDRLVAKYESLIPAKPSQRFHLDAWLISDLAMSWSNGTVKLPGTIVPLYGKEWSWHALPWAWIKGESNHVPFAITFPGSDALSSIDLLGYPWLAHELGHGLFAKCSPLFVQSLRTEVEDKCRVLHRKTFADSAEVRARTLQTEARLRRVWQPSHDQQNWAHELAVDVIALWTCGPAFLAAMSDVVDSMQLNPFVVDTVHPPYALRVRVLDQLAEELGWKKQSARLRSIHHSWQEGRSNIPDYNTYVALVENDLVPGVVAWARAGCADWRLPRCTPDWLEHVDENRKKGIPVQGATELIVTAWLAYEADSEHYGAWQANALRALAIELNGDA